jgi:hypothetical protein
MLGSTDYELKKTFRTKGFLSVPSFLSATTQLQLRGWLPGAMVESQVSLWLVQSESRRKWFANDITDRPHRGTGPLYESDGEFLAAMCAKAPCTCSKKRRF